MATRYKVQQFTWGYRMYDSQTEEPAPGEIARYDVNLAEAELIKDGADIQVIDGEVVAIEQIVEETE